MWLLARCERVSVCVHKKTLEPRLMKGPQKAVLYSILLLLLLTCYISMHRRPSTLYYEEEKEED